MIVIRMAFLLAKSIHIVGFISWFAGLFYLVRLFVYFEEALEKPAQEARVLAAQLALMQGRLWKIITRPAMVGTLLAGAWTIHTRFGFAHMPMWLHVKLGLLVGLVAYHLWCGKIVRIHAEGKSYGWSSGKFRLFNELGTMFMVAIVSLAVFKSSMSALWGLLAWIGFGIVLMIAVKLYKRSRQRAASATEVSGPSSVRSEG